jgi:hypothetical protein
MAKLTHAVTLKGAVVLSTGLTARVLVLLRVPAEITAAEKAELRAFKISLHDLTPAELTEGLDG